RRRDTLQKRRIYAEHGVPHYWLLDAERETLTVLRLVGEVFVEVQHVDRHAAEPFDGLEISVAALFGHD
ncbi:MAG TPA: Uma2 family endonuclease, partial [Pseudomonadota bacterium]|nr:Uma2 family endonuclease [Pseudomonadota bacterium]